MITHIIINCIFIALLIPGIVLAAIPNIPGLFYLVCIAGIYGWYDHFTHITILDFGILSGIVVMALIIDFISGVAGAKWGGAHWTSLISGVIGMIMGSVFIPIPIVGGIIGMFIGIVLSEWYRTRKIRSAHTAAVGSLIGMLAGAGIKVGASVLFIGLCIIYLVR